VKRLLLGTLVAIVALPLLAALALAGWLLASDGELGAHRDTVAQQLGRALGRTVQIDGELRLALWPKPALRVSGLSIGNAAWGQAPQLLEVRRLELQSELLPLLRGRLALTRLLLEGAALELEVDPQGRRNWVFGDGDAAADDRVMPALSRSSALDLRIDDSTVAYRDATSGRDWTLAIEQGAIHSDAWNAPLAVALDSTWAGTPFEAQGSAGPLSALARGTGPYPLDLAGEMLGIHWSAQGELTPAQLADGRLTVQAQANSLDAARAVFGELIPQGVPLQLDLTVSGTGHTTSARLDASFGATQVAGTLELDVAGHRPRLTGRVALGQLDLRPWLRGAASGGTADTAADHPAPVAPPSGLDAAVDLQARQVTLDDFSVDSLDGRLVLEDGQLSLEDLKLAAKPLDASGRIALDGGSSPPAVRLVLTAPRIDTAWLSGGRLAGELSANADLTLHGLGPAEWLQSGRGTVDARLRGTATGDEIRIGLRRGEGRNAHTELDARGQWGSAPLTLSGRIGTPSHWLLRDQPTPVDLSARLGRISASATGKIADLARAGGISLALQAQAPTLADVGAVWGVRHNAEGPVRLNTRVDGGLDNWEFSDLTAEVGPARATGRLGLRFARPGPRVEGRLTLDDVRLKSLLPPETLAPGGDGAATAQHRFPSTPLAFQNLSALDADIALDGARLDLVYHALPEFAGTLRLAGGHLNLHVRGTKGHESRRSIDFETGGTASLPTVRLRVQDPYAEAASLLADTPAAGLLAGRVAMDLDLRGQGSSLQQILASLDGKVHFLMGQGTVNATSLDRLVVGVRTLFGSLLGTGRKTQQLNCAFVDLKASKGVLQGAALLDTETSTFTLDGKIDLARETITLNGTPLQKGLIRFNTSVPVRLTGPLSNPQAEIQKTSTLFRLGMLIAKLNPATALPAFGLAALEEAARGNPCVQRIREAAGKGR
jgi:uncharacterized protein involved in outer membrane biogenesis